MDNNMNTPISRFKILLLVSFILLLIVFSLRLILLPVDVISCKQKIGSFKLAQEVPTIHIAFTVPKGGIMSISCVLPELRKRTELTSWSLHLLIASDAEENIIIDKIITSEQMEWTNWHTSESFTLGIHLTEKCYFGKRCTLNLEVLASDSKINTADVYLHWLDLRYIWGRERQKMYAENKTCKFLAE